MKINHPYATILVGILCLLLFTFSCEKPLATINDSKPQNTISVKRAMELSNNFDERHDTISSLIGKPDNRSSWHSLAELEQYIAYIKKEGAEKKLDVDGIRIYFGAYGSKDAGKENYSTLFLVPTVKSKSNKNSGVKSFAPMQDKPSEDTKGIDPLNLGSPGNPPGKKYK